MLFTGGKRMSNVGEYIKKTRNKRGYTLDELSERVGYSNPYLSQIENGRRGVPSPDLLKKLAKTLDVSYIHLLQKAGYVTEQDIQEYLNN